MLICIGNKCNYHPPTVKNRLFRLTARLNELLRIPGETCLLGFSVLMCQQANLPSLSGSAGRRLSLVTPLWRFTIHHMFFCLLEVVVCTSMWEPKTSHQKEVQGKRNFTSSECSYWKPRVTLYLQNCEPPSRCEDAVEKFLPWLLLW